MVVDHAAGLHEGVADGAADELEAEFGEELAHAVGEWGARWDGADVGDVVLDGCVIDDGPEGVGEGGATIEKGEVRACVGDGGVDLQAIADDAGIGEELFDFGRGVAGHADWIEVVEGLAIGLALLEDGVPGETGLGAFEVEEFEEGAVIAERDAPFGVVVGDLDVVADPGAAVGWRRLHDGT